MTFLKRLWRKLFPLNTFNSPMVSYGEGWNIANQKLRPAYDPSEDPEKVMRGEVESYFD